MSSQVPAEAPPPYSQTDPHSSSNAPASQPHKTRNGIPPSSRRSMEDENRPLPDGWVRQYDAQSSHQFYVDTRANPPRSIWHHPEDDEQYLSTLPMEERERIQSLQRKPTPADLMAESSDEEDGHAHSGPSKPTAAAASSAAAAAASSGSGSGSSSSNDHPRGIHKLGRRMKDKMTSSTHEQREAERQKRAEEERRYFENHQALRQAMSRSLQTGEPQLLGKDKSGVDLIVVPPNFSGRVNGKVIDLWGGSGMYGNPYGNYYGRPMGPYARPYGYGYGGGYGVPLMGGLAGGLLVRLVSGTCSIDVHTDFGTARWCNGWHWGFRFLNLLHHG